MSKHMVLSEVANGQSVRVTGINSSTLKVRLMELGLMPDKHLTVLFRAPLGDPLAIDVEGYVLSLRIDEAELVQVEPESV